MVAMPCDPQAFAQFFRAFETFYRQCRPGALALPAPEPSQEVIPDTPPNNQGQQGTPAAAGGSAQSETANVGRPNTRAQAAITKKANQSAGKGKASAKGPGKGKAIAKGTSSNAFSQVVHIPSVFQEQQPQHSSTEDSAGSGLEEEHTEPQIAQPVASVNTANVEVQRGKRKSKKKHTSAKKKRSKQSKTEDDTDFILGNHLSQKKRNKILNGDYVDMFTLLPPTKVTGKGEKRHSFGKRRYRTPRAERTFENWLDGYQVFMGIVCAAYPRRSMVLVAYLAHMRRAHTLAGESAALTYDENFRRNASLLPSTRWDLRDPNYWGEDVNPYIDKKNQESAKAGKTEAKRRHQCWEFNRGVCSRPSCKYLHKCERCLGNHPASACFKSKQQPFRGGRGYFHNNTRGAPGSSHQGPEYKHLVGGPQHCALGQESCHEYRVGTKLELACKCGAGVDSAKRDVLERIQASHDGESRLGGPT
ncbi:uncharacterized protein LOC144326434 [Podarcis muralis]